MFLFFVHIVYTREYMNILLINNIISLNYNLNGLKDCLVGRQQQRKRTRGKRYNMVIIMCSIIICFFLKNCKYCSRGGNEWELTTTVRK